MIVNTCDRVKNTEQKVIEVAAVAAENDITKLNLGKGLRFNNSILNVNIDNSTIQFNDNNELYVPIDNSTIVCQDGKLQVQSNINTTASLPISIENNNITLNFNENNLYLNDNKLDISSNYILNNSNLISENILIDGTTISYNNASGLFVIGNTNLIDNATIKLNTSNEMFVPFIVQTVYSSITKQQNVSNCVTNFCEILTIPNSEVPLGNENRILYSTDNNSYTLTYNSLTTSPFRGVICKQLQKDNLYNYNWVSSQGVVLIETPNATNASIGNYLRIDGTFNDGITLNEDIGVVVSTDPEGNTNNLIRLT
jgi:hypothetical protein